METKKHFCEICEKSFSTKQHLKTHTNYVHGNPDTFKCDVCNYEAQTETKLAQHHSVVHLKKKLFKCDICPKEYGYASALKAHIKQDHDFDFNGYPCDKCDHLARNKSSLEYHKQKNHPSELNKQFTCDTCGISYPIQSSLSYHIRSVHKGIRHTCEICGSTYSHKNSLSKHIRDYHGEESKKIHKCDLCQKVFRTGANLKVHVMKIHNEARKWWNCEQCDFKTIEQKSLFRHIEVIHSKHEKFRCEICYESFQVLEYLKKHMKRRHTQQDKRFKCDKCDYKTTDKQSLTSHVNSVHLGLRPFKCKACGQGFTQNSHMNTHYKIVHLGLKPHKCTHCDKSFASNRNLKAHIAALHDNPDGLKRLKCEKCEFTTFSSSNLKVHLYQHGKPKPHQCKDCDKAYATKEMLNIHMINAHTDESAFPCNFCSMSFLSKPGLSYHIIAEHPEQREIEWYKCDQCEYKSKFKNALQSHKKTHTDDTEDKVTCDICKLSVSKKYLSTHIKKIHEEEGELFSCDSCDFKTKYKGEVKKHKDAVHLGLRHRCKLCGKDFARPEGLTRHKKQMH